MRHGNLISALRSRREVTSETSSIDTQKVRYAVARELSAISSSDSAMFSWRMMRKANSKLSGMSSNQKYQIGWPINKRANKTSILVFVISSPHHLNIGLAELR